MNSEKVIIGEGERKKKPLIKKWWFWLGIVIIIIFLCAIWGNDNGKKHEVIEKLQEFTDLEENDGKYLFKYDEENVNSFCEGWSINYTERNEFVNFQEEAVIACFENVFGYDCFPEKSASKDGFSYDLDENEIRIFFDTELSEGNLSIITYSIEEDEFTLRVEGEDYEPSDEFLDYVNECDIVSIMKKDIDEFKHEIEDNELSIEQLFNLKYEDIDKYME